jgi:hypothetical protein
MGTKKCKHESADAWPWDPSRPVAGQYEEYLERMRPAWTASTDAQPALDAGAHIAEQTRHDVAASVARHAEVDEAHAVLRHAMFCGDPATLAEGMSERGHSDETIRVDQGLVAVDLVIGDEPEPGVELEVGTLPDGSHDRIDCPCDHPPGEVGPCGGCNCADARPSAATAEAEAEPIVDLISRSSLDSEPAMLETPPADGDAIAIAIAIAIADDPPREPTITWVSPAGVDRFDLDGES